MVELSEKLIRPAFGPVTCVSIPLFWHGTGRTLPFRASGTLLAVSWLKAIVSSKH